MTHELAPLDDKQRAILLTQLGIRNIKGLKKDRAKYKLDSGYKRDPAVQAKMTAGMKGIINHAIRVRCKETGQVFDSQRDVVRHFGGSAANICDHLKGRRPSFCGYTFEYA